MKFVVYFELGPQSPVTYEADNQIALMEQLNIQRKKIRDQVDQEIKYPEEDNPHCHECESHSHEKFVDNLYAKREEVRQRYQTIVRGSEGLLASYNEKSDTIRTKAIMTLDEWFEKNKGPL